MLDEEEEVQHGAARVRASFKRMTLCFAVNHSCATTPIVYASSILDPNAGFIGNGTLYLLSLVSSLLLSVIVIDTTGLKGGLQLGTLLYSIYVGCFTLASLFAEAVAMQFPIFV